VVTVTEGITNSYASIHFPFGFWIVKLGLNFVVVNSKKEPQISRQKMTDELKRPSLGTLGEQPVQ